MTKFTCGELRKSNVGEIATMEGHVESYRDFGGLILIGLKDDFGITQIVFSPKLVDIYQIVRTRLNINLANHQFSTTMQNKVKSEIESILVKINGNVKLRPPGMNDSSLTGDVDVWAFDLSLIVQ